MLSASSVSHGENERRQGQLLRQLTTQLDRPLPRQPDGHLHRVENTRKSRWGIKPAALPSAVATVFPFLRSRRLSRSHQTIRSTSPTAATTVGGEASSVTLPPRRLWGLNPASFLAAVASLSALVAPKASYAALDPFFPNDPYFFPNPNSLSFSQWYLSKSGDAQIDMNVVPVWAQGYTGQGVVIGIFGSGVDWRHPDLIANYRSDLSHDYYDNDSDPSPLSNQPHDTATIGLAAASGGNYAGGTGMAPNSQIAVYRTAANGSYYYSDTTTLNRMAEAIRYGISEDGLSVHIKNYSAGERAGFAALMYPGVASLEQAVKDYAAAGGIFVTIAQNHRLSHNLDGYDGDAGRKNIARLAEAITVSAVNYQGVFAEYSGWGSCVTVSTPSGETIWKGGVNVLTTDIMGGVGYNPNSFTNDTFPDQNYTSVFTGTSTSAPLISGLLALAKEANPAMEVRMAKHIFARTSVHVDLDDNTPMGGWTTNSAGIMHNNNYGFGVADAEGFVNEVVKYRGVTPLRTGEPTTVRFADHRGLAT